MAIWCGLGLGLLLAAAQAGPLADDWAKRLQELESSLQTGTEDNPLAPAEQEALAPARREARAALERLREAEDLPRAAARQLPQLQAQASADLGRSLADWERRLPAAAKVDALEAALRQEQEALAAQRQTLQAARSDLIAVDSLPLSGNRASQLALQLDRLRREAGEATTAGGGP